MDKIPEFDMYEFVDDGVNKSFYTILGQYLPEELNGDFSTASLINCLLDVPTIAQQQVPIKAAYKGHVENMIKVLYSKVEGPALFDTVDNGRLSDEEFNRIFDELQATMAENPACKDFSSIKEFLDYATKTIDDDNVKPLRDAIVKNAALYTDPETLINIKSSLMNTVYINRAKNAAKAYIPAGVALDKTREWNELEFIRRTFKNPDGIRTYDAYYEEATARIQEAARKAMQEERVSFMCEQKRYSYVNNEMRNSLPATVTEIPTRTAVTPFLFDKLKRNPKKEENAWSYESLKKPELLCDIMADYSENGVENQRVVAFRHGRFKYNKMEEFGIIKVDASDTLPELIGVTRLGKDGANTYFVLMPPLSKIIFRPEGEKSEDPGEKPYAFKITETFEIPSANGKTAKGYNENYAQIVGKDGEKYNAFLNKDIPAHLKDFYAKVFFSDEYLSQVVKNNARYLGTVAETDKGPIICPSDIGKADIAAAHYAMRFPGLVDGKRVRDFDKFCRSGELEVKQYYSLQELRRESAKAKTAKQADEAPNGEAR